MRMSHLFGRTLREPPADVEIASHALLLRGGFIRQLGAGIFTYLPLGLRVVNRITEIVREEMNRIGGQELLMPVVNPADVWKETGRWDTIGAELTRFKDRRGHDMVLAMTHEEAVSDLVRSEVVSARDIPRLVYHIQTKWRDDPRPRAGLIRVREFTMKDSYSLDRDEAGLAVQYERHLDAYRRIFARCGIAALVVESDVGMMGGKGAHEFMYLTGVGEDTILVCPSCTFRANRQVAAFRRDEPVAEAPLPVEHVATPGAATIEELTRFLAIPASRTAKVVLMQATFADDRHEPIVVVIRGDLQVSETKLAAALGAREFRPATADEIAAVGAVPGYASPIGLSGVTIVADPSIVDSPNLVAGANREGYHLRNVNYGRDFTATVVADIASAEAGYPCPSCGAPMDAHRGVELGNTFKLGTRYSEAMNCRYLDHDGTRKPVVMGSYGIGIGRLLACVAEEHHDDAGLRWPAAVAPFDVHIVALKGGETEAEALDEELARAGLDVLLDDRLERPGVAFNDADLIGVPIRLTVSARSIAAGGVEAKLRDESDREVIPRGDVVRRVREHLDRRSAYRPSGSA